MVDAGLTESEARTRFYAIDRDGLLVEGMAGLLDFQMPFVQTAGAVANWSRAQQGKIGLLDVMRNAKPTVLIGVSAQGGLFSEAVVRAMAAGVDRPIIFPLSNPTSCAEATPQDLMAWTKGSAVIGTGSPFPPVIREGKAYTVAQTNNAYVFPGMGLGVLAVKARARLRRHVRRRRGSARRSLACVARQGGEPVAAGRRSAKRCIRGGAGRGEAGARGRPVQSIRGCSAGRNDRGEYLGTRLSPLPPEEFTEDRMSAPEPARGVDGTHHLRRTLCCHRHAT